MEIDSPEKRQQRRDRWLERQTGKNLRPRYAAYLIVGFWGIAVVAFGALERLIDPDTFDNVWLGMWWALQTVTTVGYGDAVPGSTAGKLVATFLLLGGLSMIAVLTGAVTSGFVAQAEARRRASGEDPVMRKLNELSEEIAALKSDLSGRSGKDPPV